MPQERLQKILAGGGLASRRAAEQLIREGRVRVNGKVVTELGTRADARKDRIEVDGKRVMQEPHVYYALHKPRGFVTTMSDPEGRPTIRDLLKPYGISTRVFPVGRLDFNTSGLLLLTNDGEFSDGMLHPKHSVPKTYVVKVQGVMQIADLDRWRQGVQLEDGMTRPAEAALIRHEGDKTWFEITIREGRNQQIRRMGDATGFRVMRLARISFAGITSEGLRPGEIRPLGYDELVALKKEYDVPRRPAAAATATLSFPQNVRVRPMRVDRDEPPTEKPGKHERRGAPSPRGRSAEARPSFNRRSEEPAPKPSPSDRGRRGSRPGPSPRADRDARPRSRRRA